MNKKKEINIILSLKNKLISVNDLYKAGVLPRGGKQVPYIYKNPRAKTLEAEVREQLRALDLSEDIDWLSTSPGFDLSLQFVFKSGITRKDCSNHIKFLEDCLVRFFKDDLGILNYDDSKHLTVFSCKSVIPKAKEEYVCINLKPSNFNIRLDKEEKPERIFLGGTCGNSTWRDELIPILKEKKFSYFNPVVSDWTPECIEIENKEKNELCNTHLYIITPEMSGVYSIAEMVNSVWECISSGKGFVWIGIMEDGWEAHQKKSLKATLDLINNISQGNSRIKAKFINSPEEILK